MLTSSRPGFRVSLCLPHNLAPTISIDRAVNVQVIPTMTGPRLSSPPGGGSGTADIVADRDSTVKMLDGDCGFKKER